MDLFLNPIALPGTVVSELKRVTQGTDPFNVTVTNPFVDQTDKFPGLPTISVQVAGMDSSQSVFFIDYYNDKSVVWAANCTQYITVKPSSCSNSPTLVQANFTG